MNVLIIEDEVTVSDLVKRVAKKIIKCKAYQAFDGASAHLLLKEHQFDIIFCDIQLKETTGPKVLLGADLKGAEIVFMSAISDYDEHIKPMIEAGYNVDFIRKPFVIDQLRGFFDD